MLKKIGGVRIQSRHKASCHCGSVMLELSLPDGVNPFAIPDVPTNDGTNHPADRREA